MASLERAVELAPESFNSGVQDLNGSERGLAKPPTSDEHPEPGLALEDLCLRVGQSNDDIFTHWLS